MDLYKGLVTDMGFAFDDGYNTNEFRGCDLVLAGDIHKHQVLDIPNGKKAYMVGVPNSTKFWRKCT